MYLNASLITCHALLHKNIFAGPHDVCSVEDGLEVINTELVLVHLRIALVLTHTSRHRGKTDTEIITMTWAVGTNIHQYDLGSGH